MTERYTIADGDIMATGSSCVWDYDSQPGDRGIPSDGDSCTIRHTCTMSTGALSLSSLTMQGQTGTSYSQLSISGGSFSAASLFLVEEEMGGLTVSGGTVELSWTGTKAGPSYATSLACHFVLSGGTLTLNGDCAGGAAGTVGTPPESAGQGGNLVQQTGGALVINGDCIGGTGDEGTIGEEGYSYTGGAVVSAPSGGGTIDVVGDVALASGQDALSGIPIDCPGSTLTITGNVLGGREQKAVAASDSGNNVVYGRLSGNNSGKFVLTGELATDTDDVWAYYLPAGATLDLTNLDLTNAGTFCVFAAGGTVTTTGAEVTNEMGAQYAVVGPTIPTVTWSARGLTQQQVQEACAAALTAYDPPTKAEMDAATAAVTVAANNDKSGYSLTSAYDAAKTAAPATTALSNADWTAARAALLDNLGVGGPLASSAEVSALQTHGDQIWATAEGFAAPGDAMTLVANERAAIAKAVLSQDVVDVEGAANDHSLCYVVLAASQSTTNLAAGTLTVFKSDGTTPFAEKTISSEAGAAPITGVS